MRRACYDPRGKGMLSVLSNRGDGHAERTAAHMPAVMDGRLDATDRIQGRVAGEREARRAESAPPRKSAAQHWLKSTDCAGET